MMLQMSNGCVSMNIAFAKSLHKTRDLAKMQSFQPLRRATNTASAPAPAPAPALTVKDKDEKVREQPIPPNPVTGTQMPVDYTSPSWASDGNYVTTPIGVDLKNRDPLEFQELMGIISDIYENMCRQPFRILCLGRDPCHPLCVGFQCEEVPRIQIMEFLHRLVKYCSVTAEVLIQSLWLIATIRETMPSFPVNALTLHRLLLTSLYVMDKYHKCDRRQSVKAKTFAAAGGLPLKELLEMEVSLLIVVDYKLVISHIEYAATFELLLQARDIRRTRLSAASRASQSASQGFSASALAASASDSASADASGVVPMTDARL
jgi:hypothetical protein